MGFFGSRHKTFVSSQVYNLAGDKIEELIPLSVFSSVYLNPNHNIATDLVKSIVTSPAFKLRNYAYWLKHNTWGKKYLNLVQYKAPEFSSADSSTDVLEAILRRRILGDDETHNMQILFSDIGGADYQFWGERYLSVNYPEYLANDDYGVECDIDTSGSTKIIISIYDLTSPIDPDKTLPKDTDVPYDDYYPLVRKITYEPTDYEENIKCLYVIYKYYSLIEHTWEEPYGNDAMITKTEWLEPDNLDDVPLTYFIYKNVSSGSEGYDAEYAALFSVPVTEGQKSAFIIPPIPLRINNHQVSETNDEKYKLVRKACRKVFGDWQTYRDLDKGILDHKSRKDFDYVYIMFGVAINTKNWAGKRYLFNFAKMCADYYMAYGSTSIYLNCKQGYANFNQKISWESMEFKSASSIEDFNNKEGFEPEIDRKGYAVGVNTFFTEIQVPDEGGFYTENVTNYAAYFIHKKGKRYEYVKGVNMEHHNYVHSGKSTVTYLKDVKWFDAKNYAESSFIFPIHEGIFRMLPAHVQAQMSKSFAYLLFNVYVVKKIKWYQTSFFKAITMTIMVIIIAVATYYSFGSTTKELAGMAASVKSALVGMGVNAAAATVMVAIAKLALSAIVGLVVAKLTVAGLKALGVSEIWAEIAGAVAGFLAGWATGAAFDPGSVQVGTATESITTIETAGSETIITTQSQTTPVMASSASEAISGSVYNVMTSPLKLLSFASKLFETGFNANIRFQTQELQDRQEKIQELQEQTMQISRELEELKSPYEDWIKKNAIVRAQTRLSPDGYFYLALQDDYANIALNYTDTYLNSNLATVY